MCLFVTTDKGHVYAFGDNKMAQLGLGHQSPFIPSPTRIQYRGPPIRRLACGAEFGMIVDVRGNLYSFGCPENGQLGTVMPVNLYRVENIPLCAMIL